MNAERLAIPRTRIRAIFLLNATSTRRPTAE